MKYTSQQYNQIFDKLPQEIKDVVASLEVSNRIWKIGENHKLHIDKIGIMHDLARDVMMGIVASKNFVQGLQDELEISALDAASLARDIDDEIFRPIKATMIKIYGDGAPLKPSSSLVQFYEEEEEHHNIDKDVILREIENPVAPVVRKEEVKIMALETAEEVEEQKEMARLSSPAASTNGGQEKKVSVNTDVNTEKKIEINTEIPKATIPNISMLDKIASLKLSQTTVMPKADNTSASGVSEAQNPVRPTAPAAPNIASAPQTPPPPKSVSPDPYREPLI